LAFEIERKFLLRNDDWRGEVIRTIEMRQGYLSRAEERSIRVRLEDHQAFINIKSSRDGIHRHEFEYEIPYSDAEEIFEKVAMRPFIEKRRHIIEHGDLHFEVDEFFGDNAGLVVAEIEIPDIDHDFEHPEWLGEEVSSDHRYYNTSLVETPYNQWQE
jgi:adenylate cyclase